MTRLKNYYLVENPKSEKKIILAETKFEGIAIMVENDGHKFSNSKYKCKKIK